MDLKHVLELSQACLQQVPTVILGSGASVPHGIPGMWLLGQHLAASALPPACSSDADAKGWADFLDRIGTQDLESALSDTRVTEAVLSHIIETTWRYLNTADLAVFQEVLKDRNHLPLSRLFRHLLASTAKNLNVVTPNYDRLAEYAAEAVEAVVYTGFGFGLIGSRLATPPRVAIGGRPLRTISVWKVHGSFGWFLDNLGDVVSLPPMVELPAGFTPAIVTPGTEKYRRTHDEPFRSAMHCADDAVTAASSFLCIGFGFNDPHLQSLVVKRCVDPKVPLVLLTKEITPTAHNLFASGRLARYMALEECPGGTRVFSTEVPRGIEIPGPPLWQLGCFLDRTT